jgi:hypothetical protein
MIAPATSSKVAFDVHVVVSPSVGTAFVGLRVGGIGARARTSVTVLLPAMCNPPHLDQRDFDDSCHRLIARPLNTSTPHRDGMRL